MPTSSPPATITMSSFDHQSRMRWAVTLTQSLVMKRRDFGRSIGRRISRLGEYSDYWVRVKLDGKAGEGARGGWHPIDLVTNLCFGFDQTQLDWQQWQDQSRQGGHGAPGNGGA